MYILLAAQNILKHNLHMTDLKKEQTQSIKTIITANMYGRIIVDKTVNGVVLDASGNGAE